MTVNRHLFEQNYLKYILRSLSFLLILNHEICLQQPTKSTQSPFDEKPCYEMKY